MLREPKRSSISPAMGEPTAITTSMTAPPPETKVRAQPSSCSQVGISRPIAERDSIAKLRTRNITATTIQP